MSLKTLNDKDLIESTLTALKSSREAEVNVLKHFREIEERRLWVDVGSLYQYLSRTFKLSDDQIYPRLQAMRLMNAIPEVELKLETGALTVTTALKAQQAFRSESKSREVTLEEKKLVLESLENVSTRNADKLLAEKYPATHRPLEKVKPVSKNQNLIQFYVDDETLREIEKLKARHSHQMPEGKMEDLIKILIRQANRDVTPRKRITVKKRSRHIQAEVKREMEKSRAGGCSHVSPDGARCGSHHFLQLDHILEYSRGGSNEADNLRWLCGFHNRARGETGRGVQMPDWSAAGGKKLN